MTPNQPPPSAARRPTISDLASEVGLAKGTVSRALNGYTDINPATRQRILEAAERLGYAPLSHAQAIRTGQVRALGLVLQLEQHDSQRPFLAEFLRGITQAASARNWTLTMATADSVDEGLDTYRRLIRERKADGFILPRSQWHDPRVALLRRENCPFVLFGRTGDAEGCAWFDIKAGAAMQNAVARLHDFGHRRIGFIGADATFTYARKRHEGYLDGLAAVGLPHDPAIVRDGRMSAPEAEAATDALLDQASPPTALICATDLLAVGTIRAVRRRGLVPGRDVSVIGYDGTREGQMLEPPLTSYAVDQTAAGARLAELLIARIGGADPETLRETADAVLRPGGTDGPPPMTPQT